MEFPPANTTFGDDPDGELGHYRRVWAAVTNAIARFEPVSLICNIGDGEAARRHGRSVGHHPRDTDRRVLVPRQRADVRHPSRRPSRRGSVAFQRLGPAGVLRLGRRAARRCVRCRASPVPRLFASSMVNEGGGIHVDGEGTVMVTTTVQLDPFRNPDWRPNRWRPSCKAYLGVEKVIWLPRGLTKDYQRYGTRGHVDMFAAFVRPGLGGCPSTTGSAASRLRGVQGEPGHPAIEHRCTWPAAGGGRDRGARP